MREILLVGSERYKAKHFGKGWQHGNPLKRLLHLRHLCEVKRVARFQQLVIKRLDKDVNGDKCLVDDIWV